MNKETFRNLYTKISLLGLLCLPTLLLYGHFLQNPLVFDDLNYLTASSVEHFLDQGFRLDIRWLSYATYAWTKKFIGPDLALFHWGNLVVHLLTTISLFFFLQRLFQIVIIPDKSKNNSLSAVWFAFFGALIFSLHPVSVYAVSYLSQRSILMATFFSLLTWLFFLEGLTRQHKHWLWLSTVTYLLAVLSKEHAIMTPAVLFALMLLVSKPSRPIFQIIWPTFVIYLFIAIFVVLQVKSKQVIGNAYEPSASDLLSRLGSNISMEDAYPLSMLTQSYLFFKYWLVWIVPSPAWMSVDIYQSFALHFWSWPETAGLLGFIIYCIAASRFLLQRGITGLLGFGMLCPLLLFATEFTTVRIQESFVLYRSYLWMASAFAMLPFLCQKLNPKQAVYTLVIVALFMMPLTWLKLRTFSHPLLLWDDAARLVDNTKEYRPGMERIFYNRGTSFIQLRKYQEALEDLSKAIQLASEKGSLAGYSFYNRGGIYMVTGHYKEALMDYTKAIELGPRNPQPYVGKAQALQKLNDPNAAKKIYDLACSQGNSDSCMKK
jgi:protein O-mannosyl-transferase